MLAALFLIGSLIGALLTFNGLRRRSLWLPALVTGELPLHHLVSQFLAAAYADHKTHSRRPSPAEK